MRREGRARFGSTLILFLGLSVLFLPGRAMAQAEQWCQNNPAACVCSRTFQGGAWKNSPSASWAWYQPGESTASNICGAPLTGFPVIALTGGEAPTAVSAGLGGRQATRFTWTVTMSPPSLSGLSGRRVGFRYYHWWSPDFASTSIPGIDGATQTAVPCSNDKYTQMGDYLTAYADHFTTSNGGSFGSVSPRTLRGRWAMIEHYIQSYGSAATTHEFYLTDLTTGTASSMRVPGRLSLIDATTDIIHRYRAGTCNGYYTVMYAAMASWPAGGSQRIPQASEISGGGTTPPSEATPFPGAPANLRFLHFVPSPLAESWKMAAASPLPPMTREASPWASAAVLAPLAVVLYGLRSR